MGISAAARELLTGGSMKERELRRHMFNRRMIILQALEELGLRKVKDENNRTIMLVESPGNPSRSAAWEIYPLTLSDNRLLDKLLSPSVTRAIEIRLGVEGVKVQKRGTQILVYVPSESRGTVTFSEAYQKLGKLAPGLVILGQANVAEAWWLSLSFNNPANAHAACIGAPGSGKSTLMQTMALSALLYGAQVALFDPTSEDRSALLPLSGHPRVWRGGLFRSYDDVMTGLESLTRLLGKRQQIPLLVFVDEVPDLVAARPVIAQHLARLSQAGRNANIHLILGAQHPLASELGPTTMRNTPVRLVGKVTDKHAAHTATGLSDTGAELLRGGGDFIAVTSSGTQRFQAARVEEAVLRDFQKRYPIKSARVPVRNEVEVQEKEPGRPMDDIDQHVIDAIREYTRKEGIEPSANWIYRYTKRLLGHGYGRDKAARAIEAARGKG